MLCAVIILIIMLKYHFCICLCSMLISLSNVSYLLQNGHFPILAAIFVTIAMVKVKLRPDLYTWTIVMIN